jgi:SAM-dependent MidA family methyltransferase
MTGLPSPPADALALGEQLAEHIRGEVMAAGGALPFSRYMELCLYSPGLGYYSAGLQKFGADGDFVTAPEVSPLFGQCLAQCCSHVLQTLGGGDILEIGAGSGRLAVDLLAGLAQLQRLPDRYLILERSADLRERQQALLRAEVPRLAGRVTWLDDLPESGFRGIMLANEVLDAMPVERFRWDGKQIERLCVQAEALRFGWTDCDAASPELSAAMLPVCQDYQLAPGYISEVNLMLPAWLQGIAAALEQGVLLLADYGYPRHEYYHPQRDRGTLMCHYRHQTHDDPFVWPGLQDLTAHVDFTAVAEAASASGLDVAGYTTQAAFLLDCGLEQLLQAQGEPASTAYLRAVQQVKTLIMPGEMGERFKFIALTKDLDRAIPGFRMQDMRERL